MTSSSDWEWKELGDLYEIKLSTKTINVRSNFRVDIYKLFTTLPITNYSFIVKNRGRRSKDYIEPIQQVLAEGSIITLKYRDQMRGVDKHTDVRWKQQMTKLEKYITNVNTIDTLPNDLGRWLLVQMKNYHHRTELMELDKYYTLWTDLMYKYPTFFSYLQEKVSTLSIQQVDEKELERTNSFGNCLTIVIYLLGKIVNVKLCNNGRFQIAGAKSSKHVREFMIWLLRYSTHSALIVNGTHLKIYCCPILTNFNFAVGYCVDRNKLANFIHNNQQYPEFNSHFEPCSEYTGVTIQSPPDDVEHIPIDIMTFYKTVQPKDISKGDLMIVIPFQDHIEPNNQNNWLYNYEVEERIISFDDYISSLPTCERDKEYGKYHPVKFFVFQSGKVLLTNTHEHSMKKACSTFQQIMKSSRDIIEEKIIDDTQSNHDMVIN